MGYVSHLTFTFSLTCPYLGFIWPRDQMMPTTPWHDIEANPNIYIDPGLLPRGFKLRDLGGMTTTEVWALAFHIQNWDEHTMGQRFCFGSHEDTCISPAIEDKMNSVNAAENNMETGMNTTSLGAVGVSAVAADPVNENETSTVPKSVDTADENDSNMFDIDEEVTEATASQGLRNSVESNSGTHTLKCVMH